MQVGGVTRVGELVNCLIAFEASVRENRGQGPFCGGGSPSAGQFFW